MCRSLSTPGRAEFGQPPGRHSPPPPSHEADQDRNQLTQHSEPPAFPPVCPHVLPRLSEPTSSALRRGDVFRFGHRWLSAAFTRAAFIFLHQPGRSVKRKHLTCQSCEFPAAQSHDPSSYIQALGNPRAESTTSTRRSARKVSIAQDFPSMARGHGALLSPPSTLVSSSRCFSCHFFFSPQLLVAPQPGPRAPSAAPHQLRAAGHTGADGSHQAHPTASCPKLPWFAPRLLLPPWKPWRKAGGSPQAAAGGSHHAPSPQNIHLLGDAAQTAARIWLRARERQTRAPEATKRCRTLSK